MSVDYCVFEVTKVGTSDIKLKGAVREIGIMRDSDRYDSFNIVIGIAVKTDGRVTYEEAERLSSRFRREYLGKDVEFLAVSIPCPICGKILNSESGLKKHISMNHPDKVENQNSTKTVIKNEKTLPKKGRKIKEKTTSQKSYINSERNSKSKKISKNKKSDKIIKETKSAEITSKTKSKAIEAVPKRNVSKKLDKKAKQLKLA